MQHNCSNLVASTFLMNIHMITNHKAENFKVWKEKKKKIAHLTVIAMRPATNPILAAVPTRCPEKINWWTDDGLIPFLISPTCKKHEQITTSQVQYVYNRKYFVEECCTHEIWGPRLRILQPTLNTVFIPTPHRPVGCCILINGYQTLLGFKLSSSKHAD